MKFQSNATAMCDTSYDIIYHIHMIYIYHIHMIYNYNIKYNV